jgi:PD-(D/E)XK nuclease superfamily protein
LQERCIDFTPETVFTAEHAEIAKKTMEEKDRLDQITRRIIGAVIEVHKTLGPGLLESAYQVCLTFELRQRGLSVHVRVLKNGLKRIVNEFPDSAISACSAVNQ